MGVHVFYQKLDFRVSGTQDLEDGSSSLKHFSALIVETAFGCTGLDVHNVRSEVTGAATGATPVPSVDGDERGTLELLHDVLISGEVLVGVHIFYQELDFRVSGTQDLENGSSSLKHFRALIVETALGCTRWRRITPAP